MLRKKISGRVIAIALSLTFVIAMLAAGTASAFATTPTPTGYTFTSHYIISGTTDPSNPDGSQYSELAFVYPSGGISIYDEDEAVATLTIEMINPNGVWVDVMRSANVKRTVTIDGFAETMTINIGPNTVAGQPTANWTGIVRVNSSGLGNWVKGQSGTVGVDDFDNFVTIIPQGSSLFNNSKEPGATTATVMDPPAVRGMIHVGIYSEQDGGALHPIATEPGPSGVYAFTTHGRLFYELTTTDVATLISGGDWTTVPGAIETDPITLPDGYEITQDGASFTITNLEGEKLFVYIVNDALLNAYGMTYEELVENEGVLPYALY